MNKEENYEPQKKALDFIVRYQVQDESSDALVLKFIQSYPFGHHKELILQALRAFWLPLAYHESGQYSPQEVQSVAHQAVALLTTQAHYINSILGLNLPSFSISQTHNLEIDEDEDDSIFQTFSSALSDEGFTRDE